MPRLFFISEPVKAFFGPSEKNKKFMTKVRGTQGLNIGIFAGLRRLVSKHISFSLRSRRTRRFNDPPTNADPVGEKTRIL